MSLTQTLAWLARLSPVGIDLQTFQGRFFAQKGVFLLKHLRYEPALAYSFSLYIRGPYSPSLARDYYSLAEVSFARQMPSRGIPKRTEVIIGEAFRNGQAFVEAATSLLIVAYSNPTTSGARVRQHVTTLKPHLNSEIGRAWAFLNRYQLVVQTG